ncbi:MAG: CIA30 family protein [Cyanobacteria bacterium SID2]|nr:CIA30 family protein [Cyanobacteria bacterium SID2]
MADKPREPWQFGRFLQTLSFFGEIPFVGNFRGLQKLLGMRQSTSTTLHNEPPNTQVVLVVGATGGVGKRVVKQLQKRGIPVRGLVRNAQRGRAILGNEVDLVEADITVPETLTPQVFENVRAVICCTGTRVQPVEGDTPTREKYYQGIKFYLPEVVETPEYIEYRGIENLVNAVKPYLSQRRNETTVFDFTQPLPNFHALWGAVDDVVMGGVSESGIRQIPGSALFSGNVSTANSGGFASVRTQVLETPLDLSQYEGIQLRLKGDGKRYKFILRSDDRWDGISYCYSFDTVYGIWMTVRVPFSELIPNFRARTIETDEPFPTHRVTAFQLMLSKFEYDGTLNPKFQAGSFQLEIESIQAYGGAVLPQFVMVSSAGVTRPGKPGLNLDKEPPAVRMNEQLGGLLTWKLQGEESLRNSGIPYSIVRPCALTEEPGGQPLMADKGDTIKGQCSRNDIAELCIRSLERPEATNQTFEVKQASPDEQTRQDWDGFFKALTLDRSPLSV